MSSSSHQPAVPSETVTLAGGGRMPLLGFGTWQIKGRDAVSSTRIALEAGYRHLDTATVYGNEAEVGRGLHDSGISREQVFVTTKCPPNAVGHELETLRSSLKSIGTEYVDLWLIHWPADSDAHLRLWEAFITARETGLTRDIGVSNFDPAMIDQVRSATEVAPAVNQIEWSPLLYDARLVDEHRARGVALEGYSALRGGTLDHPTIVDVARRLDRTTAQVIIRWHLQHEVVVIPKSRREERIRSNADVAGFELTADDMAAIDALGVSRRSA